MRERARGWTQGTTVAAAVACALLLTLPPLALAARKPKGGGTTEPASKYDAPGQLHNNVCATPRYADLDPNLGIYLRYLDSSWTGFSLLNPAFTDPPACASGQIRLDLHEVVPSPGGDLVFHRGGSGYVDSQNVKYGQVKVADLNGPLPNPVPSGDGRGAPCTTLLSTAYKASIQPIPDPMKYKTPEEAGGNNSGASYLHYGDPASQQGDRHDIHYSTITWSWIDVSGGGHNRVLLAPGQDVRPCDVTPIKRDSWDTSGNVNGWVIARYVQTSVPGGTKPLYGWMVWQHRYFGDSLGTVDHFVAG